MPRPVHARAIQVIRRPKAEDILDGPRVHGSWHKRPYPEEESRLPPTNFRRQ